LLHNARTDIFAPAIDMNLAPFLHAVVLALVWYNVLLVGQIMTSAESIAPITGAGGSSPGFDVLVLRIVHDLLV